MANKILLMLKKLFSKKEDQKEDQKELPVRYINGNYIELVKKYGK